MIPLVIVTETASEQERALCDQLGIIQIRYLLQKDKLSVKSSNATQL